MRFLNEYRLSALVLIASIALFPASNSQAFNYNASASSASVFRFQRTMATKGHANAQYKLAMMYETGISVEKNLDTAKDWYNKSAYQNYKPARNRLTFLNIKQNGLKDIHANWLKELKHDATYGDGEALFLLGQMYADGVGIEKDLSKSVSILQRASASNIPGSEAELARVEKAYAMKTSQNRKSKQQAVQKAAQADKLQQLQNQKNTVLKEQKQREARKIRLAEKRALREKQAIAEQQRQFAKSYTQASKQKKSTTKKLKPTSAQIMTRNNVMKPQENDLSADICSGSNRFMATCR
jgi:TPR repeat protein